MIELPVISYIKIRQIKVFVKISYISAKTNFHIEISDNLKSFRNNGIKHIGKP